MPSVITVSGSLVQADVLNVFLTAFKRKLLKFNGVFSTVFNGRLDGNSDTIQVPYIPLDSEGSVLMEDGDKYSDHASDAEVQAKAIQVNKRRVAVLSTTSKQRARNRFIPVEQLMMQKAEALASDVLADILSVFTAANFPGTTIAATAAADFDFTSAAQLRELAESADWQEDGRSLILKPSYITGLFAGLPNVTLTQLGDRYVTEGKLPRVETFAPIEFNRLPHNGERLRGVACLPSAVGVAFAPIEPESEVREKLSIYEPMTDEETGLQLTYKSWGDPDADSAFRVVECTYGYAPIETAAALLINEPA